MFLGKLYNPLWTSATLSDNSIAHCQGVNGYSYWELRTVSGTNLLSAFALHSQSSLLTSDPCRLCFQALPGLGHWEALEGGRSIWKPGFLSPPRGSWLWLLWVALTLTPGLGFYHSLPWALQPGGGRLLPVVAKLCTSLSSVWFLTLPLPVSPIPLISLCFKYLQQVLFPLLCLDW